MTLRPANPGFGFQFQRIDLAGQTDYQGRLRSGYGYFPGNYD